MRVERLELIGFKSFADKTVFNFHPGITAIVGPNGCGKSNIVDAFKWVLGEQSAKSLRGDSMEDVIFSGSATKKVKGMAEVTLVLSDIVKSTTNGSGEEQKTTIGEIAVTRRLFRSGESEYLMNKVPCRLKDIKDVFLDTGLELKAYSILEQGRMDQILNSKPQDRRFLIEEVAGVMKYKVRRTEALNKLESSRSNLQRIQDIVAEVKRQLNTIDRHAKKAERYKKLIEEVRDIELRIAKRDSRALHEEIESLTRSEDEMKGKEAEISSALHSLDSSIEEKKRLNVDHEKHLGELKTRLHLLEKEVTEEEGRIALLKSDCENMRGKCEALLRQDGELAAEKERTEQSIRGTEESEAELHLGLNALQSALDEKNLNFSGAEEGIKGQERELEELRRRLFTKAEDISNLKNEINHLALNIENISRKAEKSSQDISLLNDSLGSLQTASEETERELIAFDRELGETRALRESLAVRLKEKKQELTVNEESLYREREELAGMVSKFESLSELDQLQRTSLNENIKALCQVADIVETTSQYETAIEAVLGDKLSAAIMNDRENVMQALQYIKEQRVKRSGFIPVNQETVPVQVNHFSQAGVIGDAVRFVTPKEGFQRIAESLLSDVVLVDNLDTAFALRQAQIAEGRPSLSCLVTIDGEVLEPSGMVFGGSGKEVLKVKRMIKELEQEITVRKGRIFDAENVVAANREDIVFLENEIISADGKIFSQEKYRHSLELKLSNLREEGERLKKKHEYISLEITDDNAEKGNLQRALEEKDGVCKGLEHEKQQIEDMIRQVQETLNSGRESLEVLRSELTDTKLTIASTRERIAAVRREVERLNGFILELEKKKLDMSGERISIEENIRSKEQDVAGREDALKAKIFSVSELQTEVVKAIEVLDSRNAELEIMEKQQRAIAAEIEEVRSGLNHVEMKKMELSMTLNYLKEDVRKTYSIEIDSAEIADTVQEEEEARLSQLRERIQELGPVSLGTLDEYEELKTRHDFLSKQRDDLLASIDALQETIQKINRTTQKRLTEAFEALNEKFREVFTTLFGKGRAELSLTEGSILDAGIEIIAQPPGKRLQNLMLLSGGEKALTALSLLFAGFMIKPTPLCILDEVDAPLDESNTDRFISLLKELSGGIQFITITHNRRTMEAANYIYGITMEEPGSSKVVSMHLAEAV